MSFHFYILYSPSLDRYYYGHTENVEERLRRHNSNHKGFTGKKADWNVVFIEDYPTKELVYARERQIKGWKNRKRIEELIRRNAELGAGGGVGILYVVLRPESDLPRQVQVVVCNLEGHPNIPLLIRLIMFFIKPIFTTVII